MGDGNEGKRGIGGMEKLSLETNRNPRDLLQRFMATNQNLLISMSKEDGEDEEEIELNLGLSLGGRFGVDRSDKTKLTRSASVAACLPIIRDDVDAAAGQQPQPVSYPAGLIRTSSLPVETEAEWRKRKELQCLRRMEAKRRRSEKQRNLKSERSGGGGEIEVNLRGRSEREQSMAASPNHVGLAAVPPLGLPSWAASAARHGGGVLGFGQSSGYIESQGGSSSGISESESRLVQGTSSCGEASPSSIQSFQQRTNQERENASAEMETPSKIPSPFPERRGKDTRSNSMDNMPCVFTQGDGPNGRRIDGILYRYGKGEEVRIMCICHGSFLSPAEFVKHAGGNDVAHPLKHIVVNPVSSTNSFL